MSDEIDEIGSELDCEGFESLPRHHSTDFVFEISPSRSRLTPTPFHGPVQGGGRRKRTRSKSWPSS